MTIRSSWKILRWAVKLARMQTKLMWEPMLLRSINTTLSQLPSHLIRFFFEEESSNGSVSKQDKIQPLKVDCLHVYKSVQMWRVSAIVSQHQLRDVGVGVSTKKKKDDEEDSFISQWKAWWFLFIYLYWTYLEQLMENKRANRNQLRLSRIDSYLPNVWFSHIYVCNVINTAVQDPKP
jgi:hypothetical protein